MFDRSTSSPGARWRSIADIALVIVGVASALYVLAPALVALVNWMAG